MALDLLVVGGSKEVDEGLEEVGLDDGGLVHRVDRNVSNAGNRGENERQVGGLQEAEEWVEAVGSHDIELVLLIGSKVSEGKSCLALDLGRSRVHQVDQGLDQLRLGLGQFPSVAGIDGDVAEGGGAVVLNIDIGRGE